MSTLLVIDDEPNVRYSLVSSLQSETLRVITAQTAREGIDLVVAHNPDVVLLDVRLPDMSGLEAVAKIHEQDPRVPVIMITAHGTTDTAIEAIKRGAMDYLLKPFELRLLRDAVARALEVTRMCRVQAIFDGDKPPSDVTDRIVGRSPAMQEIYKSIGRVSRSDVTVLLLGESGVGKELVARAIYQHSPRKELPFLAINCAAIPETLLESELFGHERGAFTGAERQRIGKFEQASKGTIFLDEIGDMSAATQAKVLRLLQDQRFERVGGSETIQTHARIIAATNQHLEELVQSGRFRRDLFYRLNVYSICIPPLRERKDDIPLLVDHFVHQDASDGNRRVRHIAPETLQLLQRHHWPGNVRELQATIKNALVNARTDVLTPDCLPRAVQLPDEGSRTMDGETTLVRFVRELLRSNDSDIYRKVIFAVDEIVLREMLLAVDDNQVEAANRLGISRTTLRAKLQTHGLACKISTPNSNAR